MKVLLIYIFYIYNFMIDIVTIKENRVKYFIECLHNVLTLGIFYFITMNFLSSSSGLSTSTYLLEA